MVTLCGHAEHFADNQQYWIRAGATPQPHLSEKAMVPLLLPRVGLLSLSI